MVCGDESTDPEPSQVSEIGEALTRSNQLIDELVVNQLVKLSGEARRDLIQILCQLARRPPPNPPVEYIEAHPELYHRLFAMSGAPETGLAAGTLLRELIVRSEVVTAGLLTMPTVGRLVELVGVNNFELAGDAYLTLRELFTRHKAVAARFLEANYDPLLAPPPPGPEPSEATSASAAAAAAAAASTATTTTTTTTSNTAQSHHFFRVMSGDEYLPKRQLVKLLAEVLLDRSNFIVMNRYISSADNLKLVMNLLRDKSKNIQFEAFHVFKVFVANPNKKDEITAILARNRDRLVDYLTNFLKDKEDIQMDEEKKLLISTLRDLEVAK
jgi:calcium binding protein 39